VQLRARRRGRDRWHILTASLGCYQRDIHKRLPWPSGWPRPGVGPSGQAARHRAGPARPDGNVRPISRPVSRPVARQLLLPHQSHGRCRRPGAAQITRDHEKPGRPDGGAPGGDWGRANERRGRAGRLRLRAQRTCKETKRGHHPPFFGLFPGKPEPGEHPADPPSHGLFGGSGKVRANTASFAF
jgi:hypothetical protein